MVAAALSLCGLLVALYLWLWKLGMMGEIACGTGGCETVQLSRHAVLFGVPVAVYGVAGYALLLAVSLLGVQPRWQERREPSVWLAILSGVGVGFTLYLTYVEAFVIEAWCRWCLVSAGIIGLIFITSLIGVRGTRDRATDNVQRAT